VTPRDRPPQDPDRFADLLGDAKRLESGPARVEKRAGPRKTAPRDRSQHDASPSFRWPEPENRHLAASAGINDRLLMQLRQGDPEPEEHIDLHGTHLEEAKRILAKRIQSARARELRCLIIVHGLGKRSATGEAVLRDAVPEWLTRGTIARHILAFAPAPRRLGGEGATLALLRKP
jgi:DNA-nicking Smr family endonuclease